MGALLQLVRTRRQALAQAATVDDDLEEERLRLEGSLIDFVEAAWPWIDASEYQPSWAIDALSLHLQSIVEGKIRRLLANYPPRCAKTNVASICFPAWVWARRERSFLSGPNVRFLCASYGHGLSIQNSTMTRRLINSLWYQERWGDRFYLMDDQNAKQRFDNDAGGSRIATSVGGSLLGIGGDILVVDDPHNTTDVESEAERETVTSWWKELSSTRLNDPRQSAVICVMQRLHSEDVSGKILDGNTDGAWDHLCIPMRYDHRRHGCTVLGWHDPRGLDAAGQPLVTLPDRLPRDAEAARIIETEREDSLMWPERFGEKEVRDLEKGLGDYLASGRLQQSPAPKGGGLFKREWWQLWEPEEFGWPANAYPIGEYVVASLDSAFTEKEQNDPSALTVWSVFEHPTTKKRRLLLVDAWRKYLQFSGPRMEREPAEILQPGMPPELIKARNQRYRYRTKQHWGLIEHVRDTCLQRRVHKLLIEAKANGISTAQELANRFRDEDFAIELVPVKGDKMARAIAAQATFSNLLVYAPWKDWSEMVIDELAVYPFGKTVDLVDSCSQAIKHLRARGLASTDDEVSSAEVASVLHRGPPPKPIYPI